MTVAPATSSTLPWQPVRQADATLVAQLAEGLARRIDEQGLRPGTRLPSIRKMAEQSGVSRFTVVEAYDRLVARGLVQSRRGAGFRARPQRPLAAVAPAPPIPRPRRPGWTWPGLLRSMFRETSVHGMPGGAGLLPPDWLDPEMVAGAVRAVGRSVRGQLVSYGHPQGFCRCASRIAAGRGRARPSRAQSADHQWRHARAGPDRAAPGQTRRYGAGRGSRLVPDFRPAGGVWRPADRRRAPDGPDTALLDQLAAEHKPKLFIINSAVHNPTGHTLSAGIAYEILRIAERHDFLVVEDDTYGDLHPGGAMKLAVLDRLRRVILVSGYSKMLAASLRVGYVAAHPDILQKLADLKMLAGLTSPELGERVIHRVLMEGQYRRHAERVRAGSTRLAGAACKG